VKDSEHNRIRPHLRLVVSPVLEAHVRGQDETSIVPIQQVLFPFGVETLAVFVAFNEIKDTEFLRLLDLVRPTCAVDLRLNPRFEVGSINRQRAFREFESRHVKYCDVSAFLRENYSHERDIEPSELARTILAEFRQRNVRAGPVIFFVSSTQSSAHLPHLVLQELGVLEDRSWDLSFFPAQPAEVGFKPKEQTERTRIFISHANPEDNEFASWLQSRLTNLGFSVWSDLQSLGTGDIFWDEIEKVIRHECVRFVAVLSKSAQSKQGCLDEINLAINIERTEKLANFVIPVRVDDLSFGDVRANLARKNIADFSGSWVRGLQQLVATLERDKVPRNRSVGPSQVLDLWRQQRSVAASVVSEPETLLTNWLSIESMPRTVYLYQGGDSADRSTRVAVVPYKDIAISWGSPNQLQDSSMRLRSELTVDEFLSGNRTGLVHIPRNIALNVLTNLTRQQWNLTMAVKGLRSYPLSGRRVCWFFPADTEPVTVSIGGNRKIRRKLTGRSERRKVNWHFAIEANVALTPPQRIALVEHVIFTQDNGEPVDSKAVAHRLRRGFCKSWWNDRWRDLLLAALREISGGAATIPLTWPENLLAVSASPVELVSPVSLREAANDPAEVFEDDAADIDFEEDSIAEEEDLLPFEEIV
jgi:hypothetical protein